MMVIYVSEVSLSFLPLAAVANLPQRCSGLVVVFRTSY